MEWRVNPLVCVVLCVEGGVWFCCVVVCGVGVVFLLCCVDYTRSNKERQCQCHSSLVHAALSVLKALTCPGEMLASCKKDGLGKNTSVGPKKKKRCLVTSLGSQREPSTVPAQISVVRKKSQLKGAEHLNSGQDAPKTHCTKRVFSEPLPRDDDGKHYMTGAPSEHATCQERRHAQNTDNLGPLQLENICVFGVSQAL